MDRLFVTIKWALVGWGAVSLVFCLWSLTIFMVSFGERMHPVPHEKMSLDHFQSLVDGMKLDGSGLEGVPQGADIYGKIRGHHLSVYMCGISRTGLSVLMVPKEGSDVHWYHGDQLPPVIDNAVTYIGQGMDEQKFSWFPQVSELRSSKIEIYPWSLTYAGAKPVAATVIFVRDADQKVFYVDFK